MEDNNFDSSEDNDNLHEFSNEHNFKHSPHIDNSNKANPWIAATIILGIALLIMLILFFTKGGLTGNVIAENDAGDKVIEYLNSRTGGGIEYISTEDLGNLYEITVKFQGQEIPVYMTKDGKYFVQGAVPLTGEAVQTSCKTDADCAEDETCQNGQCISKPQEVPKSDKPVVEAFIFSYCPYGLQFEKVLLPVYDLLKNKADFEIVAIGAMHGEYEKTETLRQISIEKSYSKDKLFSYLKEFNANTDIGACRGDSVCLDKYIPGIYKKLGIDKSKIEAYMKTNAEKIYGEQNARAEELGIGGSPTFVINDVKVQVARTPEAIKQAVCSAFNDEPSECSQTLSSTGASAGFGASASASGNTGAQC